MECHACGAELDPRDKFCSKCGAVTERGKGANELASRYVAELANGLGKLFAAALGYVVNPENRTTVAVGGGIALILLVSLTSNPISRSVGGLFEPEPEGPTFNEDGTPNFADYEDVFLGEEGSYLVTGQANIRDFPTSQGTGVIGALVEGETVMAREVRAFDPESQWFNLSTGGYVWGRNLTPSISELSEVSDPVFPNYLHGQWSDRSSCSDTPSYFAEITPQTIMIDGQQFGLMSIQQASDEQPIYNVAKPDTRSLNLVPIQLLIGARGRTIALKYSDSSQPLVWLADEGLLQCG